jgi:hypothetical protein
VAKAILVDDSLSLMFCLLRPPSQNREVRLVREFYEKKLGERAVSKGLAAIAAVSPVLILNQNPKKKTPLQRA